MKNRFWLDALSVYFEGLLKGEDRLRVIAPWGAELILTVLQFHKVEPFARELHLSSPQPLPEFQALFEAEHFRHFFRDEIIQDQICEIDSAFHDKGIEFLTLKGLLWSDQIYPSPLYRHLGDIDLLIKPSSRDEAIELLFNLGYVLSPGMTLEEYLNREGEVVFAYPPGKCPGRTIVELHWHPINAFKLRESHLRGRLKVDSEDFFGRAKSTPFRTFSLLFPRPEVCFGYQIVHGICQHRLEQLLPLVDLSNILRRYANFDFRFLLELMRKWRAMVPLFMGLKILNKMGLKEGPQEEILSRLEKVMPRWLRSFMKAINSGKLLLSYNGGGKLLRKVIRRVSTMPSEVMI